MSIRTVRQTPYKKYNGTAPTERTDTVIPYRTAHVYVLESGLNFWPSFYLRSRDGTSERRDTVFLRSPFTSGFSGRLATSMATAEPASLLATNSNLRGPFMATCRAQTSLQPPLALPDASSQGLLGFLFFFCIQ